jgi:hypothetical protein
MSKLFRQNSFLQTVRFAVDVLAGDSLQARSRSNQHVSTVSSKIGSTNKLPLACLLTSSSLRIS